MVFRQCLDGGHVQQFVKAMHMSYVELIMLHPRGVYGNSQELLVMNTTNHRKPQVLFRKGTI